MDTNTQETMFSSRSDEWATPPDLFAELNKEFEFDVDLAAQTHNKLCDQYLGPDHKNPLYRNAVYSGLNWLDLGRVGFCNPPYSMCKEFVQHAWNDMMVGFTTVLLVPARTDTKWFHEFVWDRHNNRPHTNIELRFIKGRLKFGGGNNSAPFPSIIIIFHGVKDTSNAN